LEIARNQLQIVSFEDVIPINILVLTIPIYWNGIIDYNDPSGMAANVMPCGIPRATYSAENVSNLENEFFAR
jgi:hypothetical protein